MGLANTTIVMMSQPGLLRVGTVMLLPGRVHIVWLVGERRLAVQLKIITVEPQPLVQLCNCRWR